MLDSNPELNRAIEFALNRLDAVGGDPFRLPQALQVLVLVHAAQGIIDNGGLQYFFEVDFPGRPCYSVFFQAYRAIGAGDEADALEEVVELLFPFPNPELHQPKRDKALDYLSVTQRLGRDRVDELMVGNGSIWEKLAKHVALHRAEFAVES
jgi:hypothetical protein